jgi:hypothetical protein
MLIRKMSAIIVGCTLLLAPIAANAADRGPSTPEERKQALEYIHDFEANPLGPNATQEREWVIKWIILVPDLTVHACIILDKQPKGDKKDSVAIFGGQVMAQTAFILENPDKKGVLLAEYQAGIEGALHVYELLLKANPKDRQPYLDDLVQRRDAGTLAEFVKERAAVACKN